MKLTFKDECHEFRELLCKVLGCGDHKQKQKPRFWIITFDQDERIPRNENLGLTELNF